MTAHVFASGKELLAQRLVPDAAGQQVLDVDGLMVVNRGGLDLTKVHVFRGKGQILVMGGDCRLGTLLRYDQGSGDTLKLYLNDGSFQVTGIEPVIKIEASLAATVAKATDGHQGVLAANRKQVHILGNLIVDFLPIDPPAGFGLGPELLIKHDPKLFTPADPFRVSVGQVRTLYAVNTGEASW